MIRKLFDVEGPVVDFLEKCGQLIVLSALWLLCCIPVVTLCASSAALYDGVFQTVRKQEGNAIKTFFSSIKRNFLRGIALTVILLLAFGGLWLGSAAVFHMARPTGIFLVLMILISLTAVYVPAVMVRFPYGVGDVLKLSFVLSLQFTHVSLLLALGTVVLTALQIYVFPMSMILILPGVWCWCGSFLLEKAVSRYSGKR